MLRHQILNKIKKRDDGETVLNLFPIVISSIILLALVVIYATWIANVDKKDSVDQIIRKYTIKLETVGYLDDTAQASLLDELRDAGMVNPRCDVPVTRNGISYKTTDVATSYGQPIYLVVTGTVVLDNPQLTMGGTDSEGNIFSVISGTDDIQYSVIKETTSKRSAEY